MTAIHPVEFLNIQCVYISPMFTVPMYARKYRVSQNNFDEKEYTVLAAYCIMLLYIYYHGIIDHSGITFKVFYISIKILQGISKSVKYTK